MSEKPKCLLEQIVSEYEVIFKTLPDWAKLELLGKIIEVMRRQKD